MLIFHKHLSTTNVYSGFHIIQFINFGLRHDFFLALYYIGAQRSVNTD